MNLLHCRQDAIKEEIILKKIGAITLALLLFFTTQGSTTTFAKDIEQHWARQHIEDLVQRGIMSGYEDGTYRPNLTITRAEFTVLLVKALDLSPSTRTHPFTDLDKDKWYTPFIATAHSEGLIAGKTATTFNPQALIARQEMSAIIARALTKKGIDAIESTEAFLDDSDIALYAKPAVKKLQHLAIVSGKVKAANGKYYFKPLDSSTRAEAAVMVGKFLKQVEQPNEIIRTVPYAMNFQQVVDRQIALPYRPQTDYGWTWYDASRDMVAYAMNPNNFKSDEEAIYQFLVLSGQSGLTEQKINSTILQNKGVLTRQAKAFLQASHKHRVNDVYLLAHALLETGNGTSQLARGVKVGLDANNKPVVVTDSNQKQLNSIQTTYNVFGIGAIDQCALSCGAARAYNEQWFSVEEAIIGGAQFISNGYISKGQDTLYKMRWNPEKPGTHQYATDVGWATKQTKRIKEMFDLVKGMGGHPLVFEIPQFQQQPAISARPTGDAAFLVDPKFAGQRAFITQASSTLHLRKGPHLNFPTLGAALKEADEVTIIGHNKGWYKVRALSGEGWLPADRLQVGQDVKLARMSDFSPSYPTDEHFHSSMLSK